MSFAVSCSCSGCFRLVSGLSVIHVYCIVSLFVCCMSFSFGVGVGVLESEPPGTHAFNCIVYSSLHIVLMSMHKCSLGY